MCSAKKYKLKERGRMELSCLVQMAREDFWEKGTFERHEGRKDMRYEKFGKEQNPKYGMCGGCLRTAQRPVGS